MFAPNAATHSMNTCLLYTSIMIITTVISCLAAVIPILFYDMTEKKQAEIIADLKERAEAEI